MTYMTAFLGTVSVPPVSYCIALYLRGRPPRTVRVPVEDLIKRIEVERMVSSAHAVRLQTAQRKENLPSSQPQ